jgi:predicted kinase
VKIVIAVGLPGSGKSTYFKHRGWNAISSDEIRRLIADDPEDQTFHARVFATIRYLIRQRLATGRPVTYVDATHLTRWERRPYIQLARRYGCKIEVLFFDVPVETCIERNKSRERVVPSQVIREMSRKLQVPTLEEGFDRVIWPRMNANERK